MSWSSAVVPRRLLVDLVVVALLLSSFLALAVPGGRFKCARGGPGPDAWHDADDGTIDAFFLCDGFAQCEDGSDEAAAACDGLTNALPLAVNESVVAVLNHTSAHASVHVSLCGDGNTKAEAACSAVEVTGLKAGGDQAGALAYSGNADCKGGMGVICMTRSGGTVTASPLKDDDPEAWVYLPTGRVALGVQRRVTGADGSAELAVWLAGHPEWAATVAVGADSGLLRVRYRSLKGDALSVVYEPF